MTRSLQMVIVMLVGLLLSACGEPALTSATAVPVFGTPDAISVLYPAAVLGIVIDNQGNVLHVEPGSGAAQAGIQIGDQIKTINGVALQSDHQKAKQQLVAKKPMEPITLLIRKDQQDKDSSIDVQLMPQTGSNSGATPTPVLSPNDYM